MTEKRYFIVDVEETHQENAVWQYNDKLDDYDFVCFEDDSDKLVMKLNEFVEENKEHQEEIKKLKTKCILNKQYEENQQLIKMLDNVANYMQKQHKDMPIDDFIEWWNNIATDGYECTRLLNRISGDETINDCENCLHFNELIHWEEGLFQQCMMGNKMWEKCNDYEYYKS